MRHFQKLKTKHIEGREIVYVRLDRNERREGLLDRLNAEGIEVNGRPFPVAALQTVVTDVVPAGSWMALMKATALELNA